MKWLKRANLFARGWLKRKLNINNLNKIIYKSVYTKQLFTQYQHSVKRLLSRYAWYQKPFSNLRTLCADCNLGKSSSYDANYKYAK